MCKKGTECASGCSSSGNREQNAERGVAKLFPYVVERDELPDLSTYDF
jgi:hypothetical protein